MTSERYQQVKKIFLQVCDIEEASRAEFLERACGSDLDLRNEVESLLRYHNTDAGSPSITAIVSGEFDSQATTASDAATLKIPESRKRASLSAREEKRYAAGDLVADRYRIVSYLGGGGMGRVYRADDLKLGQSVALKFLTCEDRHRDRLMEYFRNEVRMARAVTHPSVCRVHDIGESDGEVFISMEYVDGEDLTTLLRRIGCFPRDRGLRLAAELCVGISAAHQAGILHRDLKPSNVMIDGRGRVKIADLGIAMPAPPRDARNVDQAGTPGYMAPELAAGEAPSVQSDIYALGLIIYEILTGRYPFDQKRDPRERKELTADPPSAHVEGLDPVVDQVVLSCLSPDPRERPTSAYQVATSLLGRDPLTVRMDDRETPSPDTVMLSTALESPPKVAVACWGIGLVALLAVMLLADQTFLIPKVGLDKPPAVLVDRAQEIIQQLDADGGMTGRAKGYEVNAAGVDYILEDSGDDTWRERLEHARPYLVHFEYREGENWRRLRGPLDQPSLIEDPGASSRIVRLRPDGRLLLYRALPGHLEDESTDGALVNWDILLSTAGLDRERRRHVSPMFSAPVSADSYQAWEGEFAEDPEFTIRVEAAALDNHIVYFELMPPWRGARGDPVTDSAGIIPSTSQIGMRHLIFIILLVGGIVLARRNLKAARGDRRGARRLAYLMAVLVVMEWILDAEHAGDLVVEAGSIMLCLRSAVFSAGVIWVLYIALEPIVRRYWPHAIISWTRLWSGRHGDALVGRDVIIGGMAGAFIVLLLQFNILLNQQMGWAAALPLMAQSGYEIGIPMGPRFAAFVTVGALSDATWIGLLLLMIMLLARMILKHQALSMIAFVLITTVVFAVVSPWVVAFPVATNLIIALGMTVVFARVGLLAAVSALFALCLLINSPLTLNMSAWYAETGAFAPVVLLIVWTYGLYRALGRSRRTHTVPL